MNQQKTLMVMAGGTGGHVYPAMAVADYLVQQGWKIVWLVTEGGMENRLIANKPYASETITMRGVRGKGAMRLMSLPAQLWVACSQAMTAMRKHKPDVVLGMGGFAAFPGGMMAKAYGVPLVIHEQNSIAGLTNKVLSRIAQRVLSAFPSAFGDRAQLVGNPVRAEISALALPAERMAARTGRLRLLVVGGSLGAQVLNEVIPQALALLPVSARPEVIHQAGVKHIEALQAAYQQAQVQADARAYLEDMAAMYAWSDLVICRAGALTIAELAAAGLASVLVPFPFAVDDHQTHNAAYLADAGAAILMAQSTMTAQGLAKVLGELTREKLLEMANKAHALGKPEATATVANICAACAA